MRFGLALSAATVMAPLAFAQEPPPPPPPDPSMQGTDVVPSQPEGGAILPNMLPTRIGATIDVRVDYANINDDLLEDVFLLGMTAHAQYIAPEGYGGYLSLPYYYGSNDDVTEQGIGNIELGGLYRIPSGPGNVLLLRGGVALNTADDEGAFLSPYAQLSPRLYDAYPTGFDKTWLKGEGSYRHDQGNLRVGLSAGVDVPVGDSDEGLINLDIDALAKAAVSFGVQEPGSVGFGVGLTMLYAIGGEGDEDPVFGFNATVDVPVSPTMSVYGAFGLPDLDDNIDEFDLFGVGVGLQVAVK